MGIVTAFAVSGGSLCCSFESGMWWVMQLFLNLILLLSLYVRLLCCYGINNMTIVSDVPLIILYTKCSDLCLGHMGIDFSGNCIVDSSHGGQRSGCWAVAGYCCWKKLTKDKSLSINRTDECFEKLISFPLLHGNK